ncbi:MAG: glycosyltransferase family 4 protein [Thermoanaerobaculia bacterium]|nr:glycosyltransferase family 4 protein [Thermoanaerobaculia bacterium]
MKILLVNDRLYPDFIGGVEKRNYDLALALGARGHEVTLAGFGEGPSVLPANVCVLSFGPLGRLYSRSGKRSRAQAFRFAWRVFEVDVSPFDVVEASSIPYIHVPALALRCMLAAKPLLVTWYEFWGPYWRKYMSRWTAPAYRLGEWLTAQLGTAVIATSRLTAERLEKRRLHRDGVDVVACGIDLAQISELADAESAGGKTIVYAGRLIREKRVDVLLAALHALPASLSARVAIYGEGPERESLERMASALGLGANVEFRGHVEESKQLWKAIRAARIAVQPSSREGFGIFPLEAMALGVPVVYCDSEDNAVPELVRDGIEGLASAADPESLARTITRLLEDDELRARLGRNGMRRAAEFDRGRMADVFETRLRRMASATRSSRGDDEQGVAHPRKAEHPTEPAERTEGRG